MGGLWESMLKFNDEFWGGFAEVVEEGERELVAPEGAAVKPVHSPSAAPKAKHLKKAQAALAQEQAEMDASLALGSGMTMSAGMHDSRTGTKAGKKD